MSPTDTIYRGVHLLTNSKSFGIAVVERVSDREERLSTQANTHTLCSRQRRSGVCSDRFGSTTISVLRKKAREQKRRLPCGAKSKRVLPLGLTNWQSTMKAAVSLESRSLSGANITCHCVHPAAYTCKSVVSAYLWLARRAARKRRFTLARSQNVLGNVWDVTGVMLSDLQPFTINKQIWSVNICTMFKETRLL